MKNKNIIVLICLLTFNLVGCSNTINSSNTSSLNNDSSFVESSSTSSNIEEQLPFEAKVFIETLELWINDEITLEYKSQIDAAYIMYNGLVDEVKQLDEVIAAKEKLDLAKEKYLVLYENYLANQEAEITGQAFKELVDNLGEVESLIRDDSIKINEAYNIYNNLSNVAKELAIVIEAKAQLDKLNERITVLIEMSDEEYAVVLFITSLNKLPTIDELTIFDIEKVQEVTKMYEELSEISKQQENVQNAKELLDSLNTRVEDLIIIKEHTDAFIDLIYSLPSFSELKWNNASQQAEIENAENAYNNLTEEERCISTVQTAYNELQAIKDAFYNLKEPYDISMLNGGVVLGGFNNSTNNYDCELKFNTSNPFASIANAYNIPQNELTSHLRIYLNMYNENSLGSPLYRWDITENYTGYNAIVFVAKLKELKDEGNTLAVSGKGYRFNLNIESLNDNYASSEYSTLSVGITFNF